MFKKWVFFLMWGACWKNKELKIFTEIMWNRGCESYCTVCASVLQENEPKFPGVFWEWHDSLHIHGCLSDGEMVACNLNHMPCHSKKLIISSSGAWFFQCDFMYAKIVLWLGRVKLYIVLILYLKCLKIWKIITLS
jgi:hypothetical protein